MQHIKISPPEQDQFTEDHRILYHKRHMGSVIAYSGIYPSSFSRRLNNDEVLRDHLYDTVMEMYASVMSEQSDVGRGIVKMFNRFAAEFGLLDEEPINILKQAIDQLYKTSQEDIRAMSSEERASIETFAAELKEVAGHVHQDAIIVRREGEFRPRNAEIPGDGLGVRSRESRSSRRG